MDKIAGGSRRLSANCATSSPQLLHIIRLLGGRLGDRPTLAQELATDALQMAWWHRHPQSGLLHHSDRAVQYAASAYQALLDTFGLRCSMSRRANCWDNAVVESFFATLECVLINPRHSYADVKRATIIGSKV
jgi:transposase InsO family protein